MNKKEVKDPEIIFGVAVDVFWILRFTQNDGCREKDMHFLDSSVKASEWQFPSKRRMEKLKVGKIVILNVGSVTWKKEVKDPEIIFGPAVYVSGFFVSLRMTVTEKRRGIFWILR